MVYRMIGLITDPSQALDSLDIKDISAKITALELEVANLRQGYVISNTRYTEAISSLHALTTHASDAATLR